jgi:hypothetical protein
MDKKDPSRLYSDDLIKILPKIIKLDKPLDTGKTIVKMMYHMALEIQDLKNRIDEREK